MSISVLFAEDEARVRNFVKKGLEQHGFTVNTLESFRLVEDALTEADYDVIVLDRLFGDSDSLSKIPDIKKNFPLSKVLVLSALSEVHQRVRGLDLGADEYLGKPFHIEELVARIRNLVRQRDIVPTLPSKVLTFLDLHVDLNSHRVSRAGVVIDLTLKEFRLLTILAEAPEKVFTRAELLSRAWDINFDTGSNLVDVTVGRLRKKLNRENFTSLVHPIRGVGYSLKGLE